MLFRSLNNIVTNTTTSANAGIVVIGGGIGGLTAGALLARQGKRVALRELDRGRGASLTGFQNISRPAAADWKIHDDK